MLLEISKQADLETDPTDTWAVVGSIPRLADCIPGVSDLRELERNTRYSVVITDKLGPFTLRIPLELTIERLDAPTSVVALVSGNDGRGQARVSGRVEASIATTTSGTCLRVQGRIDVLGRLAALGATPMRRRADFIFDEFLLRLTKKLTG